MSSHEPASVPVALSRVGRSGRMELVFARQGNQTIIRKSYCEVPFKVTRMLASQPAEMAAPIAHAIWMHCTAGLFGGDELDSIIHAESGARVLLTQQSATRVHPSAGRVVAQRSHIKVFSGAELHLIQEPVIPFAESRLSQSMRLDVESMGKLIFWEGFLAGRIGRGECWQFSELASETALFYDRKLIHLDRFSIHPADVQAAKWIMGRNNYIGTGLYVGHDARSFAATLHDALPTAGIDCISKNVALVRVVTLEGPAFHQSREVFTRVACRNPEMPRPDFTRGDEILEGDRK